MTEGLYEAALREWIARKIRRNGHRTTRDDIRNVTTFGVDYGFTGTDVTPGDEPVAGIKHDWRNDRGHWIKDCYQDLEFTTPVQLIQECLAIAAEIEAEA